MNLRFHRDPDTAPTPLRRRLLAWAHSWQLDEALLDGADPSSDPVLAERAARLANPENRHRLADALRGLIESADAPPRWSAAVPVARASIRAERDHLLRLAGRLDDERPVDPRGVAVVTRLISDGASPLWAPGDPLALAAAVDTALAEIEA